MKLLFIITVESLECKDKGIRRPSMVASRAARNMIGILRRKQTVALKSSAQIDLNMTYDLPGKRPTPK